LVAVIQSRGDDAVVSRVLRGFSTLMIFPHIDFWAPAGAGQLWQSRTYFAGSLHVASLMLLKAWGCPRLGGR